MLALKVSSRLSKNSLLGSKLIVNSLRYSLIMCIILLIVLLIYIIRLAYKYTIIIINKIKDYIVVEQVSINIIN